MKNNQAPATRGEFGDKLFAALLQQVENDTPVSASLFVGIGTVCNDCGKPLTREELDKPYTGLCKPCNYERQGLGTYEGTK